MGAEASQCSSCSSARFCNLASEQGASAIQSEYEPQRAGGFQEENEALPPKETQAERQPKERSPQKVGQGTTLPSSFEYVPDQRGAAPKKAASPAASALAAASPGNGQPVSDEVKAQVVQKLQNALDTSCADIRELETLLEEARQAGVEVPEVRGIERRVRALRAIESINQAAGARNLEKLGRAIDDARAAGVPEAQLSKAVQMLEALKADRDQRKESERRGAEKRKQENAVACLQRAMEERDAEKLTLAIAGAEREGVPSKDLEAAKKLLADLRHDSEKRSGGLGTSMFRRKPKS